MADRIRMRLTALVESVPLMNEIVDFTPPDIKSKVANNEGSFVMSEDVVGFEALKWTLKSTAITALYKMRWASSLWITLRSTLLSKASTPMARSTKKSFHCMDRSPTSKEPPKWAKSQR